MDAGFVRTAESRRRCGDRNGADAGAASPLGGLFVIGARVGTRASPMLFLPA